MQQFPVPQFIDVEDKIIGPITVRQFLLLLSGTLLIFVWYKLFAFTFFVFLSVLTAAIFAILAFARVNGRPIHFFILSMIQTSKRPGLRVWNRASYIKNVNTVEVGEEIKEQPKVKRQALNGSKLDELTLIVNTGGAYKNNGDEQ